MNVAMIVPTGLGFQIGGHAGDANPVAKLLGQACDRLILHPNVVNASDLNEMPSNSLYVEGSLLDRFLSGELVLKESRSNKILLFVNELNARVVNAANAAETTLGCEVEIAELDCPLRMSAEYNFDGSSGGWFDGVDELIEQFDRLGGKSQYDAMAVYTPIDVEESTRMNYIKGENKVNPWGGIEAKVSGRIADELGMPVAHAPTDDGDTFEDVVDPRFSPEMISFSFLHSVFKGLHKAPKVELSLNAYGVGGSEQALKTLSYKDLDALVTPVGCFGRPHNECVDKDIPVIAVRENKAATIQGDMEYDEFITVDNYHEAVGVIKGIEAGVSMRSVRRPFEGAKIINGSLSNKQ